MDIAFRNTEPGVAVVLADGAVIGAVLRREMLGRGFTKSQMSTRHVMTWTPTVESVPGLDLSDDDRRSVEREISRHKTSRGAAVDHLLASYDAAGVVLPEPPDEQHRAA